ncbi:tRNA (5-methylaminomethyl-2-thiouridine)(34)-methyltransferase MnmD [Oricola thermophila]|uniref:tRNA (5-methylaminomethyl-2-thiouridine)(34)-methyltransferase MnmD n=1 Tax=Oricola thermophila TaxID=2742145 RepID=A0A6N1VF49_9HYPH|nr:tRNA (5-methylaminomethyl-2-thiouridine)(34)-methyltransferase MnmD [Oricola thermophila]QKV17769.1 tRNA (5-methylaminomethyl-2-thiouridine)(34)-methyltransferase MnmD [Oricola thermophila]
MADLERDELSWLDGDMPYSTRFGDHFYSRADGRAECGHVFMGGNGLPERWAGADRFTIGELGFGTGLNFLETWRAWRECRVPGQVLDFVSFEAFPMEEKAIERALVHWPQLTGLKESLLRHWPGLGIPPTRWKMDEQTGLTVIVGDALNGVSGWSGAADAWYLDGFAPARNPEMWSAELMQAVADRTRPGGTFASYTAAGWVRRNLEAAGFTVTKRPGHAGKREMICGVLAP